MLAANVAGQHTRRALSLLRPDRPRNPIAQFGFDERNRPLLMKHPLGLGLTAQGPGPRAPGPGPGPGPRAWARRGGCKPQVNLKFCRPRHEQSFLEQDKIKKYLR